MAWVRARICKLPKKGCTQLASTSNKVYHGRWFSPGTPASSTTETGRHDIAEVLLKVALNTKNHTFTNYGNAAAFAGSMEFGAMAVHRLTYRN